jgi:hypothetical protein
MFWYAEEIPWIEQSLQLTPVQGNIRFLRGGRDAGGARRDKLARAGAAHCTERVQLGDRGRPAARQNKLDEALGIVLAPRATAIPCS